MAAKFSRGWTRRPCEPLADPMSTRMLPFMSVGNKDDKPGSMYWAVWTTLTKQWLGVATPCLRTFSPRVFRWARRRIRCA
eukprot:13963160-Alexandrium_andersonii.AAC.1